jgi:UDP-N-acetylmuramoyl-L-alanyl-D-glutamate--2,6-diaminopimelate ligase
LGARLAKRGDILLIAGKGHEDYQIIGTEKHHFDDREEVAMACRELGPVS